MAETKKTEEKFLKELENRRSLKMLETKDLVPLKSNQNYFLMFFIRNNKDIKNIISDYELSFCKSQFLSMISLNPDCHEAYFGLCRLASYEGNYSEALKFVNKAISLHEDSFYIM